MKRGNGAETEEHPNGGLAKSRCDSDRSKSIEAEDELQRTRQLESIAALSGGIAHDYNNLLTVIIGNVSLIQSYVDPQDMIYRLLNEVNEAAMPATWVGPIWTFATPSYLVVDDFEAYDDADNAVFDTWIDGWINETSSTVGYFEAPFAERWIVNSGTQSMPLFYNNALSPFYSETYRELEEELQDWNVDGAEALTLYFHGSTEKDHDVDTDRLYMAVQDHQNRIADAVPQPGPDRGLHAQTVHAAVELDVAGEGRVVDHRSSVPCSLCDDVQHWVVHQSHPSGKRVLAQTRVFI